MLIREALGYVIQAERQLQKRTLRNVASKGNIALGYLWEIENAKKEASSEILESVAFSLGLPLSTILYRVAEMLEFEKITASTFVSHEYENASNK